MKIGIRNHGGRGYCVGARTELFVVDENGVEHRLEGITGVDIHIDGEHMITASLDAHVGMLDICPALGTVLQGAGYGHELHNRLEMERLGISRIH